MVSKKLSITGIIIALIFTGVGLFGAYFYRDSSLWLNNIYSDIFGSGVLVAAIFIVVLFTDIFDGD